MRKPKVASDTPELTVPTRTRTMSPEKVLANKLVNLKAERDRYKALIAKHQQGTADATLKFKEAEAAYETVKKEFLDDASYD